MPKLTPSQMSLISRAVVSRFSSVSGAGARRNPLPGSAAWYSSSHVVTNPTKLEEKPDGARSYTTVADLPTVKPWTRPLSPHLSIYQPQANSTSSIFNRMTGMYLTAAVVAPYFLCMKVGTVAFSYSSVYQLFYYSSNLVPLSAEIAALALVYHVYKGIGHLVSDVSGSVGKVKRHNA